MKGKNIMWKILIFLNAGIATWLTFSGGIELLEASNIVLSPLTKFIAGIIIIVALSILGWKKL